MFDTVMPVWTKIQNNRDEVNAGIFEFFMGDMDSRKETMYSTKEVMEYTDPFTFLGGPAFTIVKKIYDTIFSSVLSGVDTWEKSTIDDLLKKDGLLTEEASVSSYNADKIAEMILDLTDVALSFVDKGGMGSKVSRNLYASLEKGASKEAKKKAVDKAKDVVAEIGKLAEKSLKDSAENILKENENAESNSNLPENIEDLLVEKFKNNNTNNEKSGHKSIDDILEGLEETTTSKRSTRNFESQGGYEQTLKDFESLGPIYVKKIETTYGPGILGVLSDGKKIVARRESKSGGATLEIKITSKKTYKIRY